MFDLIYRDSLIVSFKKLRAETKALETNIENLKLALNSAEGVKEPMVIETEGRTFTPLVCVNCGGKIDRITMNCKFCGTGYCVR